jgi:hypothetical protein
MASLGSFGAAIRELDPDAERDTFDFYDETFTVCGIVPAIVELTLTASLAGKVSGVASDAALFETLRFALTVPERKQDGKTIRADDAEWQRFYQIAVRVCADSDVLTALAYNILGWQVGRPTEQRSTSESGSLPTSTNSSSPASDTPASAPVQDSAG